MTNTKNKPSRKIFTVTSRLAKKPTDPPFLTSRCVTKNYKTHPPPYRDVIIECPLRKYNQNKLVIACLTINFLRNKFGLLNGKIKGHVDILLISESKIDEKFPDNEFKIDSVSNAHRVDRNEKGGEIMLLLWKIYQLKFCRLMKVC